MSYAFQKSVVYLAQPLCQWLQLYSLGFLVLYSLPCYGFVGSLIPTFCFLSFFFPLLLFFCCLQLYLKMQRLSISQPSRFGWAPTGFHHEEHLLVVSKSSPYSPAHAAGQPLPRCPCEDGECEPRLSPGGESPLPGVQRASLPPPPASTRGGGDPTRWRHLHCGGVRAAEDVRGCPKQAGG